MKGPSAHSPPPPEVIDVIESGVRPSIVRRVLGVVLFVAAVVVLFVFVDREALFALLREAGPIPFFVAAALLPLAGFPTTPLFALAGVTFGTTTALVGASAAVVVQVLLSYWIASGAVRPWLLRRLSRSRVRLPDVSSSRASAWRFATLVHCAPGLPTFAKVYVVALAGVPLAIHMLTGCFFTIAYAATVIILGESIFEGRVGLIVLIVSLLVVAALVLFWLRSRAKKRAAAFQEAGPGFKTSASGSDLPARGDTDIP